MCDDWAMRSHDCPPVAGAVRCCASVSHCCWATVANCAPELHSNATYTIVGVSGATDDCRDGCSPVIAFAFVGWHCCCCATNGLAIGQFASESNGLSGSSDSNWDRSGSSCPRGVPMALTRRSCWVIAAPVEGACVRAECAERHRMERDSVPQTFEPRPAFVHHLTVVIVIVIAIAIDDWTMFVAAAVVAAAEYYCCCCCCCSIVVDFRHHIRPDTRYN